MKQKKVVLITGAARRIGAAIAKILHQAEYNVVIHCHHSVNEAHELAENLNKKREDSAMVCVADLCGSDLSSADLCTTNLSSTKHLSDLIQQVIHHWGRLDALINNASGFYPTDLADSTVTTPDVWDDLMNANAKAPFFLSQAAYEYLKIARGHIVNITDIHAEKPLKNYGIYTMSKALLWHQTQCLAKEWGPEIKVNAVAPGSVLWPEGENSLSDALKQEIIDKTPLKKQVNPESIAKTVLFLLESEDITGEVIRVSGGRRG